MAELIISDRNYLQHVNPPSGFSRGLQARDRSRHPFGSMGFAAPFDLPLIPRSEWPDRIADMERTKSRLSDLVLQAGIISKDQRSTNFCWFNAVTTAVETIRCVMGQPYVPLSSASGACIVKNFRNEGGWGGEALEQVVSAGICSEEKWPNAAIDRKYYTEEAKAEALLYRCLEWYDLKERAFDQLTTCNLNRLPVPIGLNWWSHEVCAMDAVNLTTNKKSSQFYGLGTVFGNRPRNSWSDTYGEKGFFVLTESKATPDDACCPRAMIAA